MKRVLVFLLTIAMSMLYLVPVLAENEPVDRMVDDADLLSDIEEAALEQKLDAVSTEYDMDVVVVTVWGLDGKSSMDYADDYYDYNGYREDGLLLLVSMEERDWWISTSGSGIHAFTDAGLVYMEEQFLPYLSDGDYVLAFETYINLCDDFMSQAASGTPYDYNHMPKEPFPAVRNLGICLVAGLVIALIVVLIMKAQLTSVRKQDTANVYTRRGSLNITERGDRFLYVHRSRTAKPKDNGGGGSRTHRSSSGRSHGGRGGKF